MTTRLPDRTLMTTFLTTAMSKRHTTVEHLADLLQPIPEDVVRSWIVGSSAPTPHDLIPLATALHVSPVELTAGWLIDQCPRLEEEIVERLLLPLGSSFPHSSDDMLIAPRPRPDFTVGDPHDAAPTIGKEARPDGRVVRKRSAASGRPISGA